MKKYDIEKIKILSEQGNTQVEIAQILGCSRFTVQYHLNPTRKSKQGLWRRNKYKNHTLLNKMKAFQLGASNKFTLRDLIVYLGNNPICFYTGVSINLENANEYSLDHKIPISRGGSRSLDNLALSSQKINYMKHNLTPEEFLKSCRDVVSYNF